MARGETYEEFTAKFEPKRTTDDCYTPPEVYDCVLRWAHREYGFDLAKVARPFYPGGDYEREEYPQGCTVVDNPPFSILSKIVKHYQERGVGFFLFAPTLTCMGIRNCCKVVTGVGVTYANGASVNTSFVTNLDPAQARSAPDLRAELDTAIERLRREKAKALPKYEYPRRGADCAHAGALLQVRHRLPRRPSGVQPHEGARRAARPRQGDIRQRLPHIRACSRRAFRAFAARARCDRVAWLARN